MIQHHASARYEQCIQRFSSLLIPGVLGVLCATSPIAMGQAGSDESLALKVQRLTEAMSQTQKRLDESQHELQQLRAQLAAVQQQIALSHTPVSDSSSVAQLSAAVEQIREQQALETTQIATHERSKVETESKYGLKLSGLVLFTGFVNTTQVDDPVTPTLVLEGPGTTGASLQQTVLGFDATGPHLFDARTHADARVDFDGASLSSGTTTSYTGGLLRLRTAHAALSWDHTEASFSLDHAIVAPNTPTSLTAVAVPALAWSGNLWTWNPQIGLTQDIAVASVQRIRLQAALIDVMNPPPIYGGAASSNSSNIVTPTTAELSRWPGAEGRVAILGNPEDSGLQLGLGGLFAPHRTSSGTRFNSWAGTMDYRIPLPGRAELSGSGYWGQALGGLGGGGFKDYVFVVNPVSPPGYSFRTLDAFGGWAQLKEPAGEHIEFNAAFGTDQVPASQLRPYTGNASAYYLNLARNRTYTGNVIYRPSAYLTFSLEYRHLQSSPVNDYTATGNIVGIATGYRF
ncbi:MAG: hypothetical protein WBX19_18080 [Terracidiphilus sp.]